MNGVHTEEKKKRDYGGFVLTAFMIFLRDGLTYFYLAAMFLAGSIGGVADFVFLLGITRGISGWLIDIIAEVTAIHKDMAPLNDMREFSSTRTRLTETRAFPCLAGTIYSSKMCGSNIRVPRIRR